MATIKTFQDFLAVGEDEKNKIAFVMAAISEHKSSIAYRTALDAEAYYEGQNPTIERYEKILYDLQGKAHADMWTANHKIASSFFRIAVDQETGYLLGNGVTFTNKETKDKLGTQELPFDQQITRAGRQAIIGGVSFGFWNNDHVEVYTIKEFIPLVDEENGSIKAGIRFWQLADDKPLRATLFEMDGYTDYIRPNGKDVEILRPKRAYKIYRTGSQVDIAKGEAIYQFENYPGFPIVPLMNNDNMKSELCGKRNTIDALDLASSNMVNNVDEGSLIYWVINNASGMDDLDDVKFLEHLRLTKVAHTEDGSTAEPHTIEAPYVATTTAIEVLTKRLYTDFQVFDSSAVTAGNQSATAIRASYVPLDLKCDKFEYQVTKFINGILALAGIADEPSYTRNQIINKQEEMQTLLMAAQYLDDEYLVTKIVTILGDPDAAEEIMKRKASEEIDMIQDEQPDEPAQEDIQSENDETEE